ncbi:laminin G domain-containing protein [Catellatospora citrea]|uniref:Alpha-L-rhamnosidase six-hairpin glycosidase domain-containing protein n=1 Tax=Catellatospora citrea TaxID=53366 RepID=A0A8J3KDD6_9ACTN|nr:laminin G domain-containing protein [Catellatospora citrea]RKE10881.1 hypothetical protein C8E86_5800 [Catellatospora citrea]GIG00878.1 hypothetical protein Cci01nite_59710 [Catellatospora citrea]
MTVPHLDELAGDWLPAADLAHLPSLRNQWGQAHANADLTSLSWLAIPPLSGGYHTGTLRVHGTVPAAERFRWSPWGVQREAATDNLVVRTDTRLGYESTDVYWRVAVTNASDRPVRAVVEQELLAMVAVSEVDWGWLYGTPWNSGHHHDFYTTERIRAEVLSAAPRQVQLLAADQRYLRLGSPRIPGIQRDEDTAPMLLETELPDHSTPDSGRFRAAAALAAIRAVTATAASGEAVQVDGEFRLEHPAAEHRLVPVALGEGATLSFEVRLDEESADGVLLTHGNHPDSVQFGLSEGRPWLRVAGERLDHAQPLAPGRWHRLAVRITAEAAYLDVDGAQVAATRPWWDGQRWQAHAVGGNAMVVADGDSAARAAYTFATPPDALTVTGSRGLARWDLDLAPGQTTVLGTVLSLHARDGAAQAAAADFENVFDGIADRWRRTWLAAFTPGNDVFSGHLPTLTDAEPGLAKGYYLAALLAVYMRNTGVSPLGPVFLTGGPRLGPTTTFYWDVSEWARVAALLEPVAQRAWILAALNGPYDRSFAFDTRNLLPVGNHYASNDHALFRIVQGYVGVTGDVELLHETAAGRTVLDHLREMAYRPRERRAAFGGGELVDLGRDPWELLECVPNYRDAVVSFNAGYVGMQRDLADLLRLLDEPVEAEHAEADAARLAAAVLRQYAGGGRWNISHPEGDETIGHVLDFGLVAADMAEDLSDPVRAEMVEFVTGHLLDGDWMRALSPDDPIAPRSDRPDHGAAGAFAAWPGATAYGLCRLGRPDLARDLLGRIHQARGGALWGQATETIGGGRYRTAERGVSNRDSNAAVAAAETVIAGLFGIRANFASLAEPSGSAVGAAGRLDNVNAHGFGLPVREKLPTAPPSAPGSTPWH